MMFLYLVLNKYYHKYTRYVLWWVIQIIQKDLYAETDINIYYVYLIFLMYTTIRTY